ncbi:MAG: IS110 family transposase [Bacteroidaceae bacterium]|nr:IS110 family transposase [Bacteroidaceae bacterium]
MYNAVGIDASKFKSTITVIQPAGVVIRKPFDVLHTSDGLNTLVTYLQSLEGETRAVIECTGRYHEPVVKKLSEAGIFISAVNPKLIKGQKQNTLRKVKSDPADARKIARYALDNWAELREYSSMDTIREQLKTLNAQFDFFMKQKVAAKTNLISLLDNTYPGINKLFSSPARDDGSEKWVDYAYSFWHVDCVRKIGLKAFTQRYEAFCQKHHYNYQPDKAKFLFDSAKQLVAVFPKEKSYKLLIQQSIQQLNLAAEHIEILRKEMNELASTLPEYDIVMSMYGVGPTYGPQLIAEIGDVARFTHREAITAFAGVDPGVNESGQFKQNSNRASKNGSTRLRKTLFQIMSTYLQNRPEDEPIYQFLDRKRAEGKPYLVYMTAGANKFLRIYYGKVKECLRSIESISPEES